MSTALVSAFYDISDVIQQVMNVFKLKKRVSTCTFSSFAAIT